MSGAADRVQAPFGAREVVVAGTEDVGPYRAFSCLDAAGPEPTSGQFYMLASSERWGGGSEERPYLPRAISVLAASDRQLSFVLEVVGPGTERLAELEEGDALRLLGPLGTGFTAEQLYVNQKVTDLISKAEMEQSDYREDRHLNVFFGPVKEYLGLRAGILWFNVGVLILRRQIRMRLS